MESDPSIFEKILGILRAYWPHLGVLCGLVLIIASRFRWRVLCQGLGVVMLGISIGALVAKS